MTHPSDESLRAYAQGNVDLTRSVLIEAHLELCPTCQNLVTSWYDTHPSTSLEGLSDDFAVSRADVGLSDKLDVPPFERVWAAVEQAAARRRLFGGSVIPASVLGSLPDPAGWRWRRAWPARVKFALLARDPETRSKMYLSYYGRASTFPRHRHLGLEENVILAGGYQNGDVHVEMGDWVVGAPGTEHAPTTGPEEDCFCLSRIEPPGLRFTGWRRWLISVLRLCRRFGLRVLGQPPTEPT